MERNVNDVKDRLRFLAKEMIDAAAEFSDELHKSLNEFGREQLQEFCIVCISVTEDKDDNSKCAHQNVISGVDSSITRSLYHTIDNIAEFEITLTNAVKAYQKSKK